MNRHFGAALALLFSTGWAFGDAASDLVQQGQDAMGGGDYATAAKDFNEIIASYPSTPSIDDIRLKAGYALLHIGEFEKSMGVLAPLLPPSVKPEFRGNALFFTGLDQFSLAHKMTDKNGDAYKKAGTTMTTLIGLINQSPVPEIKGLLEDALYYKALAAYGANDFPAAEKNLGDLLAKFPASLQRPDYLLLLGSVYAVEASGNIGDKKADAARTAAQKAVDALQQVAADPNARIQANEANMRTAEVYYLIAQLDLPDISGYAKALAAFQKVIRKDDLVPLQQARIGELRANAAKLVQGANAAAAYANSSLLDRESGRLTELQNGDDPIIQALLRIAECYIAMKEPDEARTVLHRLSVAKLNPAQQQEVDFQFLYSYALGGQADKADAALTAYLAKHPGDPQADSISVQIGAGLMKRKDYAGALKQAQRSLDDFATGKHVGEAVQLKSEALTKLGRLDEANSAMDDFIKKNPASTVAVQLLVTKGEGQLQGGKPTEALASFKQVMDNPAAGPYQPAAAAYYINTLNSLKRYDEVVAAAKDFAAKYPNDKALASVEVIAALALDRKNDPGAIPALQAVAKKFADNVEVGSYALYDVVLIEQRQGRVPEMVQAATDLRTAFPTAYALISQATDAVTAALEKQKKFAEAAAAYQPLVDVPDKAVGAAAQNKIGVVWLAAAKAMGSYQSLQTDEARAEAEKRLAAAEQAYLATLGHFPDDTTAVGDAFKGLIDAGLQRRAWGRLTDADLEGYLDKLCAGLTTPTLRTRVELAKAGLVFAIKNGHEHDAAALDRFDKALAANPSLELTTQEADHYGLLLIGAKNYAKALDVFNALLATAQPGQQIKFAEAYYGLGATYLAQGDYTNAKVQFGKMQMLPGGAAWSEHALDMQLGLAKIAEQSNDPADLASAQAIYATIMRSPAAGLLAPQAVLGYGRILEKTGHAVKAPSQTDIEYATHYYEQVNLFYGPAVPALSAEGLYLAGQAYAKAGDAASAKKDFDLLRATYAKSAPEWVAKAPAS